MKTYLSVFCHSLGAQKSTPRSNKKEFARFHLDDVDSLLSSRSGKRPDASTPVVDAKPSRTKSMAKKRKVSEPEDPIAPVEKRIHDFVTLVRIFIL